MCLEKRKWKNNTVITRVFRGMVSKYMSGAAARTGN